MNDAWSALETYLRAKVRDDHDDEEQLSVLARVIILPTVPSPPPLDDVPA